MYQMREVSFPAKLIFSCSYTNLNIYKKVLKHAVVMHESLFFNMADNNDEIHDIVDDVFTTFIISNLVINTIQQNA